MKVEKVKPTFMPICITIENEYEREVLVRILRMYHHSYYPIPYFDTGKDFAEKLINLITKAEEKK